ncbi:hypothetical protein LOC68_01195 [Blastopirellula sp. JC732]|uniref:Uncharacterized protein n=1 Tax=Blastopirellula sediminis TaxID=2894196 RepID=A0A9X1SDS6_9BACT|nr:hypothetical protein [Blastopirellula sediminis]MCC9608197.1 hypothetical protein [Blastopirellula sediminis]MCC9627010.1 hypothetical protein [Blastopirellula sediminis]
MATGNAPQKSGGSAVPKVLLGCLVAIILMVVIACGVGYYIMSNIKSLGVGLFASVVTQAIDESELPEDQKIGMKEQIDRIASGYKSGEISDEQLGKIFENIGESPVISAIPVIVVESTYLKNSGLSEEEKADAKKQLDRAAHGLFDKTITMDNLDPAMEKIAERGPEGNWEIKSNVSDDELKEFVAETKKICDEHGIPDEEFQVDIVAELKKSIDDALAQ